jgi:hypothetical protein
VRVIDRRTEYVAPKEGEEKAREIQEGLGVADVARLQAESKKLSDPKKPIEICRCSRPVTAPPLQTAELQNYVFIRMVMKDSQYFMRRFGSECKE